MEELGYWIFWEGIHFQARWEAVRDECIAFQHMVEYIATLGDDNCLPGGWFYRVEENFNI